MPVYTYETLLLLDPSRVANDAEGVKQHLHALWERHGAQILVSRPWDYNHKLAYPINKLKRGAFHIIYYTIDSSRQKQLDQDIKLQEGLVLRHLTLRLHPKWTEEMLRIAREDQSTAFALRGMREDTTFVPSDSLTVRPAEGDGRPPAEAAPPRSPAASDSKY